MRPVLITDTELLRGTYDISKYLPNPTLPQELWADDAAEKIFYNIMPANVVYVPRLALDQQDAYKHLLAIKASKLSTWDKLNYMAKLLTLWYSAIEYPKTGETK